jgi:hypothetical protein
MISSKTSPIRPWSPFLNLLAIELCEYRISEGLRLKYCNKNINNRVKIKINVFRKPIIYIYICMCIVPWFLRLYWLKISTTRIFHRYIYKGNGVITMFYIF